MKRNDPTVLAKNTKIRKSRSWYQNLAKLGQIRANPSPPSFLRWERTPPNSDTPRDRIRRPAHPLEVIRRVTYVARPTPLLSRRRAAGAPRMWTPCLVVMRAILQNSKLYFYCNWTRLNMGLVFPRIFAFRLSISPLSESDMSPFAICFSVDQPASLRGLCVVLVSQSRRTITYHPGEPLLFR